MLYSGRYVISPISIDKSWKNIKYGPSTVGVGLNKYTGGRGKSSASDANAEYVAEIRKLFDENKVKYQLAELGKVDEGGGGTIAYILANKGMDVIDCGTPVLSMHSPYEVSSKYDVYMSYKAYLAFMK